MARLDFGKCGAWTALLLALLALQGCATRGDQASAALEAYQEERYGDAELIWLEDSSHFCHVDSPERFVAIAEAFFDRVAPGR